MVNPVLTSVNVTPLPQLIMVAAAPLLTSLPATFNAIPDTTPSNDPAVIIPATTKSPAGLKVAPTAVGCPILIPLLAVISPVASMFVTSS